MPHLTRAERQLAKIIVAHLTFERYSEREIVQELSKRDPPINLSKSAVHDIRVALEKQAEKWYTDLRDSKYRYLATYKDRIDSLFKYQRMIHDAIKNKEMDKLNAIKELHNLELSIKDIYKEIPEIGISEGQSDVSSTTNQEEQIPEEQPAEQWV